MGVPWNGLLFVKSNNMGKRIVYFTNGYQPDCEGVSKGLFSLYTYFRNRSKGKVFLHNLNDCWRFGFNNGVISYPDKLLPIGVPLLKYLEKTSDLIHIYGSLTGRIYLRLIKKQPCILTSASALINTRIEKYALGWESLDIIVLESERDKQTLLDAGIDPQKIYLVYPGVPILDIAPPPENSPFTILFASAPIAKDSSSLDRRGVTLLVQTAKRLRNCRFIFLWRGKHTKKLSQLLSETGAENIKVIDRIVPDLGDVFAEVHCTILSPREYDECKPCPNSLIESLACGRPVLASDRVGISNLIEQENCGVTFAPDLDAIVTAIRKLQGKYDYYMTNALPTALKYFTVKKYIASYEKIYQKMGII